MRSDLHNLMPTDASVNQNRGSLNFDEGGELEGEAPDTFLDGDSFEPGGEPDLRLVPGMTGGGGTTLGDLCVLLQWRLCDPVDDAERTRNRAIGTVHGNLNWFIEDEALALQIFAVDCPYVALATPANAVITKVFVEPTAAMRMGASTCRLWITPWRRSRSKAGRPTWPDAKPSPSCRRRVTARRGAGEKP